MVTTAAFQLFVYCAGVLVLAGILRLLGKRFRQLALRLAVVFGVFAVATAYVWLHLGPVVDYRLASDGPAIAVPQGPRQIDI